MDDINFRGYSAEELELQFNPRATVPDHEAVVAAGVEREHAGRHGDGDDERAARSELRERRASSIACRHPDRGHELAAPSGGPAVADDELLDGDPALATG